MINLSKNSIIKIYRDKTSNLSEEELKKLIDEELEKSEDAMDPDFIEFCLDSLKDLQNKNKKINSRKKLFSGYGVVAASIILIIVLTLSAPFLRKAINDKENSNEITVIISQYGACDVFIDENYNKHRMINGYLRCYCNELNNEDADYKNNLSGIMDSNRNIIVEPIYHAAYPVSSNTFSVEKVFDTKIFSALIDDKGNILIDYFDGHIIPVFYANDDSKIVIIDTDDGKDYITDTQGNPISDMTYRTIYFSDSRENTLEAYTQDKGYYISFDGEIIAEIGSENAVDESEYYSGKLTVISKLNGREIKYGMKNSDGKEIIPCEYDNVYPLNENRIVAWNGNYTGISEFDSVEIYDADGKIVCQKGNYQYVEFKNGASVGIGTIYSKEESKMLFWLIDTDGNKLTKAFDMISANEDGTFSAEYDGKTQIIKSDSLIK